MKNSKYKELQESNRKRLMRVIKQKETTGQEGVDRSSSTSETVIPPLPPLPHHLAEGWGGGGGGGGDAMELSASVSALRLKTSSSTLGLWDGDARVLLTQSGRLGHRMPPHIWREKRSAILRFPPLHKHQRLTGRTFPVLDW